MAEPNIESTHTPIGALPQGAVARVKDDAVEAVTAMARRGGVSSVAVRDVQIKQDGSPNDFGDFQLANAVTASAQGWHIDAASLTANTLSSILTSGEQVPDNKFVVWYGFVDLSDVSDLDAVKFDRGADTLGYFEVEDVYAYGDAPNGAVFAEGVPYKQNDPIDLKLRYATGTAARRTVILGVIAEETSVRLSS